MTRSLLLSMAFCLCAAIGFAQPPGIQRAVVKKIDFDKMTLTLTVDGKDRDVTLTEKTRVLGMEGKDLKERMRRFKVGSKIMFKMTKQDGKEVVEGLKLDDGNGGGNQNPPPKVDTSKFKSLPELGSGEYQGFKGGLYPDGKNDRPAAHEVAGLKLAKQVQPLDKEGKPSAEGKIVLLSIGMSNTTQEFSAFMRIANADSDKNPKLTLVDGAQSGRTAKAIMDPESNTGKIFWSTIDDRLTRAGLTRAQVQAGWMKQADAGPSQGFPKYAQTLQEEEAEIARVMKTRFPNIKMFYLSSRTYGGYAKTRLNPEPYSYESGFAVKWLIEQQLKGDAALNFDPAKGAVKAPWLSWGPYLWANGTTKNLDGLSYNASDFGGDGTHPSPDGQRKVAEQILKFFKNDRTTKPWFFK